MSPTDCNYCKTGHSILLCRVTVKGREDPESKGRCGESKFQRRLTVSEFEGIYFSTRQGTDARDRLLERAIGSNPWLL